MKTFAAALTLAILSGAASVAPVRSAQAQDPVATAVRNFDVFVDLPTGYTFVKLPSGWKFVGKVEQNQLGNLPATVLTSLLPERIDTPDREEIAAARMDDSR